MKLIIIFVESICTRGVKQKLINHQGYDFNYNFHKYFKSQRWTSDVILLIMEKFMSLCKQPRATEAKSQPWFSSLSSKCIKIYGWAIKRWWAKFLFLIFSVNKKISKKMKFSINVRDVASQYFLTLMSVFALPWKRKLIFIIAEKSTLEWIKNQTISQLRKI